MGLLQVTLTLPVSFNGATVTLPSVGGDTSVGENSLQVYTDKLYTLFQFCNSNITAIIYTIRICVVTMC